MEALSVQEMLSLRGGAVTMISSSGNVHREVNVSINGHAGFGSHPGICDILDFAEAKARIQSIKHILHLARSHLCH